MPISHWFSPFGTRASTNAQQKSHVASSLHATNHQNPATASKIQTETVTGSHIFTVCQYSLTKGIGTKKCISSDVFTIGGYKWIIEYYPDGLTETGNQFIAFIVLCQSRGPGVQVHFSFTILGKNGAISDMKHRSDYRSGDTQYVHIERTNFEKSECLKDDSFTVECTITVVKAHHLKPICHYDVSVPSSNLKENFANLLESGKGHDVTFVVKGERFNAHRCVLAARSAVFQAELFGGMKENWTDTVTVDDMEAPVFKSMLYFIYSDSLRDFEGADDAGGKQDQSLMVQHLLVAADRYALERLRLICEDVLCKNLSVSNAATSLILAEQHNCRQLKEACIRYISSPEVFKAVALTDEFQTLRQLCPSILKDIKFILEK